MSWLRPVALDVCAARAAAEDAARGRSRPALRWAWPRRRSSGNSGNLTRGPAGALGRTLEILVSMSSLSPVENSH